MDHIGKQTTPLAAPPQTMPAKAIILILLILAVYLPMSYIGVRFFISYFPDVVTISLPGLTKTVDGLRARLADVLTFAVFVVPSVVGLELAVTGWSQSSLRRLLIKPTSTAQTDLISFLLGQAQVFGIIGRLLTLGAVIIAAKYIESFLAKWDINPIESTILPFWAQLGIYFFLYTFFDYWSHRLYHTSRFWPLHRFHHAAREFTLLTTFRQHPVDFLGSFVINLPLALLGASAEVLICVSILVTTLGMVIHSNIDSCWGFVGRYIIQSPNHHRLHHVLDFRKVGVGHYGIIPLWDHLFGTWIGDARQDLEIGVDRAYAFGFGTIQDIARDYLDALKALVGLKYRA